MTTKGFTLIEILIYMTLFSLLLGSAFLTAYSLIASSDQLSSQATTVEEGNFVLRKLDWALSDVADVVAITDTTLLIHKYYFAQKMLVLIKYNDASSSIMMQTDVDELVPITSNGVKVSDLIVQLSPTTITVSPGKTRL
jgi:prepilin-type N-terminal cleavage/methylation domain-containing protein